MYLFRSFFSNTIIYIYMVCTTLITNKIKSIKHINLRIYYLIKLKRLFDEDFPLVQESESYNFDIILTI